MPFFNMRILYLLTKDFCCWNPRMHFEKKSLLCSVLLLLLDIILGTRELFIDARIGVRRPWNLLDASYSLGRLWTTCMSTVAFLSKAIIERMLKGKGFCLVQVWGLRCESQCLYCPRISLLLAVGTGRISVNWSRASFRMTGHKLSWFSLL